MTPTSRYIVVPAGSRTYGYSVKDTLGHKMYTHGSHIFGWWRGKEEAIARAAVMNDHWATARNPNKEETND